MKKVLFIQPHSDDIVLSCFGKLIEKGIQPTILTIEDDPKRIAEDVKMNQYIPNLKIIKGVDFGGEDKSYKAYWGENMHRKFSPEEIMPIVTDFLGDEKIESILEVLMEVLDSEEWDEIYTCVGVGHPMHWFVHEITKDVATHFYRDWPHSYKKRNLDFFNSYSTTFNYLEEVDDEEILRLKLEVFKKCYKSQSGLLYFEQKNIEKNFSEKYYTL